MDENDNVKISELGLSVRAFNALKNRGYWTIGDLKGMKEKDLLKRRGMGKIRGIGREAATEIRDKVNKYGEYIT